VWAGEWGGAPSHGYARPQTLSRWQARHWSRRFEHVGVTIPAARLRLLVAGTTATEDEVTDVRFALTALNIEEQQRQCALRRARAGAAQACIFVVVSLVALGAMLALAYAMLSAMAR
jgi:hypothetical protein